MSNSPDASPFSARGRKPHLAESVRRYASSSSRRPERHANTKEALSEKGAEKSSSPAPRVRVVQPKSMETCGACRLELPEDLASNLAKEVKKQVMDMADRPAMSLCTVVEIALQFESFRNIDLFHQGLYHLKTRIYRDDESRALAVPYSHLKGPTMVSEPIKGKAPRVDHHNLIPAHLNEELYTFSTRSFLIRYCEEEVELGDIGQFRLELGRAELERRQPLLLEVELMFADLTQPSGENMGDQPDVESAEFRCVSTQVLRLRGVERGLHDFCPVVFDECHFCLLNLAVHSAVVDLRFRLRPKQLTAAKPKVAGPAPRAGAKGEEAPGCGCNRTRDLCFRAAKNLHFLDDFIMARSPVLSFLLFGALVLLGKRSMESFVGSPATQRRSVVARRAEEEEEPEKVAAPGDRLKLKVLSPEGNGMTVACSEVILPSATGQLGILANHAPMMSALDTGVLRFKEDGKWKPVVVMGGFATVDSNQLSVLVNDFEEADSIDMKEAQSEMDGATSMLEKAESKKDKLEATAKVKKAAARLQAAMFASKK
eukprot:symbB.v1.2.033719.t1/scaffold4230.1/size42768/4